jgi:hypothetical protein
MPNRSAEDGSEDQERPPSQSGMRVWLVCALFILVPAVIVLIVKYIFNV